MNIDFHIKTWYPNSCSRANSKLYCLNIKFKNNWIKPLSNAFENEEEQQQNLESTMNKRENTSKNSEDKHNTKSDAEYSANKKLITQRVDWTRKGIKPKNSSEGRKLNNLIFLKSLANNWNKEETTTIDNENLDIVTHI